MNLRTATPKDFKTGAKLYDSENNCFIIKDKYDDGIWNADGTDRRGSKVVFENEARFYKVEDYNDPNEIQPWEKELPLHYQIPVRDLIEFSKEDCNCKLGAECKSCWARRVIDEHSDK